LDNSVTQYLSGCWVGGISDSPWIVIAVVHRWIPNEYFRIVEPLRKKVHIRNLDLWHPVHTGELEAPPWFVESWGRGTAEAKGRWAAVPIDGFMNLPGQEGWRLSGRAAQRHVNAGCRLMESETTELFVNLHLHLHWGHLADDFIQSDLQ